MYRVLRPNRLILSRLEEAVKFWKMLRGDVRGVANKNVDATKSENANLTN